MPDIGGQEYFLAREQAQAGWDVHIITSDRAYPAQSDYREMREVFGARRIKAGMVVEHGFTVHRLAARFERNMQLVLRGLPALLHRLKPDVIVLHGFSRYETLRTAMLVSILAPKAKVAVDDHTQLTAYRSTGYRNAYYRAIRTLRPLLMRRIHAVLPISQETADFLADMFDVPPDLMTVVPLGIDVDRFTYSQVRGSRFRYCLGVADDNLIVLYCGKLVREKGIDLLLDAAIPLLRNLPTSYLVYVGSGAEAQFVQDLRRRAAQAGVGDRVLWHGHVPHEELDGVYSAADVAVWPTQETIAALEAASCARPIVLNDSAIGREYTASGNGITCRDASEITAALSRLAADPSLRRELGRRGEEAVRRERSWSAVAERFTTLAADEARA